MKLSDFGQEMRVVPGLEVDFALHLDQEQRWPPHWHFGELRRMHAQVTQCQCGFWVPVGLRCPACSVGRD